MLSRKLWILCCCMIISSCKNGPLEDNARADDNNPHPIVLKCELLNDTEKEALTSIIKVNPLNSSQTALQYFDFEDGRWSQPCLENGHQCRLSISSRFIKEVGTWQNKKIVTEINRSTGKMTWDRYRHVPEPMLESSWYGMCEKTTEPNEKEPKF